MGFFNNLINGLTGKAPVVFQELTKKNNSVVNDKLANKGVIKDGQTDENKLVTFVNELDTDSNKRASFKEITTGFGGDKQAAEVFNNALNKAYGIKAGIKFDKVKEEDTEEKPYVSVQKWGSDKIDEDLKYANDCLSRISANYRPDGMDSEEAMKAIMKENPQIYGTYNEETGKFEGATRSGRVKDDPKEIWIYDDEPVYLPASWLPEAEENVREAGFEEIPAGATSAKVILDDQDRDLQMVAYDGEEVVFTEDYSYEENGTKTSIMRDANGGEIRKTIEYSNGDVYIDDVDSTVSWKNYTENSNGVVKSKEVLDKKTGDTTHTDYDANFKVINETVNGVATVNNGKKVTYKTIDSGRTHQTFEDGVLVREDFPRSDGAYIIYEYPNEDTRIQKHYDKNDKIGMVLIDGDENTDISGIESGAEIYINGNKVDNAEVLADAEEVNLAATNEKLDVFKADIDDAIRQGKNHGEVRKSVQEHLSTIFGIVDAAEADKVLSEYIKYIDSKQGTFAEGTWVYTHTIDFGYDDINKNILDHYENDPARLINILNDSPYSKNSDVNFNETFSLQLRKKIRSDWNIEQLVKDIQSSGFTGNNGNSDGGAIDTVQELKSLARFTKYDTDTGSMSRARDELKKLLESLRSTNKITQSQYDEVVSIIN